MKSGDYITSTNTEDGRRLVFIFNELCSSLPSQCCSTTYSVEEKVNRFKGTNVHTTYKNEYRTYAPSTKEEIAWLDYCIAQDKYISPDKVPKEDTREKLAIGSYYYVEEPKTGFWMLGVVRDNNEEASDADNYRSAVVQYISKEEDLNDRSWCYESFNGSRIYRKATTKEIEWLDYCIAQDEYVKLEDMPKKEFKKGDYIVLLGDFDDSSFRPNYIYKQRRDKNWLSVEKDSKGTENGWVAISYTDISWRRATDEEVEWYNRDNRPVTTNTEIAIDGHEYKIELGYNGWFCERPRENSKVFDDHSIDKENLQYKILGYSNSGYFPYCKTQEDLLKFVKGIEEWIKREKPQIATPDEIELTAIPSFEPTMTLKDIYTEAPSPFGGEPLIEPTTRKNKKSKIKIELDEEEEETVLAFKVRKKKKLNF